MEHYPRHHPSTTISPPPGVNCAPGAQHFLFRVFFRVSHDIDVLDLLESLLGLLAFEAVAPENRLFFIYESPVLKICLHIHCPGFGLLMLLLRSRFIAIVHDPSIFPHQCILNTITFQLSPLQTDAKKTGHYRQKMRYPQRHSTDGCEEGGKRGSRQNDAASYRTTCRLLIIVSNANFSFLSSFGVTFTIRAALASLRDPSSFRS